MAESKHTRTLAAAAVACMLWSANALAEPASVAALASFTNCDDDGNPKNPNLKIAFSQTDLATPWRVAELRNFQLYAKKLCVPHFIWNEAGEDVSKQLSNVANLVAQKPDVLILDPIADQPLVPAIDIARKARVKMINIDRRLSVGPGPSTYASVITADNYLTGRSAAEAWVAKLRKVQRTDQPKAGLLIIMGGVGQDPANERNRGVKDAIAPFPGIRILDVQSGDWTREGGRKVMQAYLQRFPSGMVQGVYCASDEEMIGARQALEAAHRTDLDGAFFSSDGQLQGLQAVATGFDVADSQFSPLYGEPSLRAAISLSQGKMLVPAYRLDLKTFSCSDADACNRTKEYVAQLEATGMQF